MLYIGNYTRRSRNTILEIKSTTIFMCVETVAIMMLVSRRRRLRNTLGKRNLNMYIYIYQKNLYIHILIDRHIICTVSIVLQIKIKLQKKKFNSYVSYTCIYTRHICSIRAKSIQLVSQIALTEYIYSMSSNILHICHNIT